MPAGKTNFFRGLLVFDYILLHHRLYLQLTVHSLKNLLQWTLERRDTDISLRKQLIILKDAYIYLFDIVEVFSCYTMFNHDLRTITSYLIVIVFHESAIALFSHVFPIDSNF